MQIQEPTDNRKKSSPSWTAFLELGFRPLYLAACAWAVVAIGLWVFLPSSISAPLPPVYWHAHEMLWGFVGTVAIGFLLTATNNWTGANPLHGRALGCLLFLWIIARVSLLLPYQASLLIALIANVLFYTTAALAVARCVLQKRNPQNYGFPLLILVMGASSAAYLWQFYQGTDHSLVLQQYATGMLCMASITTLLARRVIPFFASRAVEGLDINRHTLTGQWQTGFSALAILCWIFNWPLGAGIFLCGAGVIALWHLFAWRPWAVRKHPLLWILYAGYAGLALGLLSTAAYCFGWIATFAIPMHTLAVMGFSILIMGMITRTALGHLGLALRPNRHILYCYAMVLGAAILRLAAFIDHRFTTPLIHISAALWMLAFAIYIYHFFPLLIRPRADAPSGKPVALKRAP